MFTGRRECLQTVCTYDTSDKGWLRRARHVARALCPVYVRYRAHRAVRPRARPTQPCASECSTLNQPWLSPVVLSPTARVASDAYTIYSLCRYTRAIHRRPVICHILHRIFETYNRFQFSIIIIIQCTAAIEVNKEINVCTLNHDILEFCKELCQFFVFKVTESEDDQEISPLSHIVACQQRIMQM